MVEDLLLVLDMLDEVAAEDRTDDEEDPVAEHEDEDSITELDDEDANVELEYWEELEDELERLRAEEDDVELDKLSGDEDGEKADEDDVILLEEEYEVLLEVEDPVKPEELLQTSTVEQTSTILQFLKVVAAVLPIILAKDPEAAVLVAALPRASVVASSPAVVVVVVSSEHCSSYLHTFS